MKRELLAPPQLLAIVLPLQGDMLINCSLFASRVSAIYPLSPLAIYRQQSRYIKMPKAECAVTGLLVTA